MNECFFVIANGIVNDNCREKTLSHRSSSIFHPPTYRTSVVRLQKKLMELEERLSAAEQRAAASGGGGLNGGMIKGGGGGDGNRNLPRGPPKEILVGHRGGVTCVVTHPVYALLVSGSEDASIKVRGS